MLSIGFEVDLVSWEVTRHCTEAAAFCAESGNLTRVKVGISIR